MLGFERGNVQSCGFCKTIYLSGRSYQGVDASLGLGPGEGAFEVDVATISQARRAIAITALYERLIIVILSLSIALHHYKYPRISLLGFGGSLAGYVLYCTQVRSVVTFRVRSILTLV